MKLIGSLTLGGKTYTLNDSKGFMFPGRDFEMSSGFYGGRVDKLAKTDTKGVLMCLEGMTPIDLAVLEPTEALKATLEDILKVKGIEAPEKATKDDLIQLLKW